MKRKCLLLKIVVVLKPEYIGFFKDGLLFCQGRMDDQIKLHGYRIELSEIEHIISSVTEVKEASRGFDSAR